MSEKQMQAALDKIVKLSAELDNAIKDRWGKQAFVFVEAEGGIHIMTGDSDPDKGNSSDRQKFIALSGKGRHALEVGAW